VGCDIALFGNGHLPMGGTCCSHSSALKIEAALLSDYTASQCRRHSNIVWVFMKENSGISDQMPLTFENKRLSSLSPRKMSFRSAWPTPSSDLHVTVISILSEAVLREHCSLYIIQAIYHLYVGRKLICKAHCHSSLVPSFVRRKSCIMQVAYLLM
jgi:hypothetical protein